MIARAIIVLSAAMAIVAAPAFAQSASPAGDGHRLFVQSCAVCHMKPSPVAKTYGPELTAGIAAGQAELVRTAIVTGSAKMPSFKYDLQPSEIDAIVAYLTTAATPAATHAAAEPAAATSGEAYLSGTISGPGGQKLGGGDGLGEARRRHDHDERL